MKSNNTNKDQNTCDRFGIYLGYDTCSNGMFVGYDNQGWFWQKYKGGNGDWYNQTRKPAPTKDKEVKVRVEWNDKYQMTLKLDNETVFNTEDFSGIRI